MLFHQNSLFLKQFTPPPQIANFLSSVYFERKEETNYLIKHIKFSTIEIPKFQKYSSEEDNFLELLNPSANKTASVSKEPAKLSNMEESIILPLVESPTKSKLEDSFTELDPSDLIETDFSTLDIASWVDLLNGIY